MDSKIKILIADDHALMRIGLKSMLQLQPDMRVIGEAGNGQEAIDQAQKLRPDVIVMDLMMPVVSGAEATRLILRERPETRIIILSSFGNSAEMADALDNGAAGAQMKESDTDEIIAAIRTVVRTGQKAIAAEVEKYIADTPQANSFTDKQMLILDSLGRGLSDTEIALQHGITRRGVQKHLTSIYAKLGAANRTEAVAIALRKHLLKI